MESEPSLDVHRAADAGRDGPLPPPLPSLAPRGASLGFTGENGEFRRLVTRGAVAELFTLGFYRFWLATRIRQYLWSGTSLDGDSFEYLGTGRELFFGFLLAIAILAPFYLLYFLAGIEAERYRAFASTPLVLAFYAFRQFAIFRARRYRLNRTTWRGLRFGMTGSGWKYAALSLKWSLLTGLTLGLAWPWAQAALERYKMQNTFYGDLQGRFDGTGRQFFARGWWLWLAPFAILVLIVVSMLASSSGPGIGGALASLALLVAPFWFATYKTIEWKWWIEGVRIGDIAARSTLTSGQFIANYWKFYGMIFVVFATGLSVGAAATFGLNAAGISLPKSAPGATFPIAFIVAWGLTYLATFLAIAIVTRIYLTQRIWTIVCNATIVRGIEAADNVTARGGTATALGEGFADSLDVMGF